MDENSYHRMYIERCPWPPDYLVASCVKGETVNEWQVYNPSHGKVGGSPSAYQKIISRAVIKIDYSKKKASFLILLVGFVILKISG